MLQDAYGPIRARPGAWSAARPPHSPRAPSARRALPAAALPARPAVPPGRDPRDRGLLMRTRGPTVGQIAVAVAFAFSCFGLLLFLWSDLRRSGSAEARGLPRQGPLRGGHPARGRVRRADLERLRRQGEVDRPRQLRARTGICAVATIEIDSRYAPIPANTRAMLRQKTLLGETYVELTQGDGNGPKMPEGGNPAQGAGAALGAAGRDLPHLRLQDAGRVPDLDAAGWRSPRPGAAPTSRRRSRNLEPFAEDANRVLRVLDTQQGAVQQLVRNTGEVFGALSERQGQLQGLIRNSGTVFAHHRACGTRSCEATFGRCRPSSTSPA